MIEYHPHPTDPNLVVLKVTKRYIAKHSDEDLQAAVLAEREACALLCLELVQAKASGESYEDGTIDCAKAIRARGVK